VDTNESFSWDSDYLFVKLAIDYTFLINVNYKNKQRMVNIKEKSYKTAARQHL